MKILVLAESFPPDIGGGATVAFELSKRLKQNFDVDLTVVTRDVPNKTSFKDEVPVIRLKTPHYITEGGKVGLNRLRFVFDLTRKALEMQEDFDLINIYSAMSTEAAIWMLKKTGLLKKPVVMNFLGTAVGYYQNIYPFPVSNIYNFIGKTLFLGVEYDKYMVLDDGTGGYEIFKKGGIPRRKMIPHYQAVDCDIFRPLKVKKDKFPSIGYMGRLDPFKGVETFTEAIIELNKSLENFNVYIRGVGPLKDKVISMAKEGGILNKIYFIKPVPHEKLPNLLNKFDVMVFPDIRGYEKPEVLSLAMCEAMACGTLFISSSKPRKEWKCKTWVNVSEPNPKEYAENILNILKNKKKYEKIKRNARRIAVKYFDWDKIAEMYYKEFLKLVD